MLKTRCFAGMAILVAAAASAATAPAAGDSRAAAEKQRTLIEVLRSTAPPPQKAITCKQLALCGNQDAVPALAPFLADKELASWARIALEVIPGPAADDALREAADKLHGNLLVGVINSIGVRGDAKAVGTLIARLKDADAEVASAAAAALGRVGGAQAVRALKQSLSGPPAAVRSAVAEGCILCAERALAAGQPAEAVRLYEAVCRANVPRQRILEATRGVILARGTAALPLLVEQLQSADKARFALGLRVARELAGREVAEALVAEFRRTTPERQALLILALADRGGAAVLPVVLQAAKSGADEVRIAAIGVLARLGNAACVPVLLDAALEANAELSQAALAALSDLPGKEVDEVLAARLSKAEGKARLVLIELAGQRPIAASVPILLQAASDPDARIRAAALMALGSTIEFSDLSVLIARVADPAHAEDAAAAERALGAACLRMPDQEACAGKLVAAMSQSPVPAKCRFLGILTALGGDQALRAVSAAAKDANAEIQDAGNRLLGEWMTLDAAPVLLDLTRTAEEKYRIRALRGYIRLARQFAMPDADRAKMCRLALQIAERDAEKKLVLEVIDRYPSVNMLPVAVEAAKIPSLKSYAGAIALATAQRVGSQSADLRKMLAEVGHKPVKVEIIKAEYGEGAKFKDVTAILRQHVCEFPVIVLPSTSYNASFGGDPAPGVVKQLKVEYRIDGKSGEASFAEDSTIMLPVPK